MRALHGKLGLAITLIVAIEACGGSSMPTAPATTPVTNTPAVAWTQPSIPAGLSTTLRTMLLGLTTYLNQALTGNQADLPRNPQNATEIQAKIAMLQNASLAVDIVNGQRWTEGQSTSIDGRAIPVVAVFPVEGMRSEAADAVHVLEPVTPLLERFYNLPLPVSTVRLWYGFVIGNSSSGGTVYTEDRTTYESRTGPTRLPFDAILMHELAHSYMGHESLNQFVEVYAYNLARGSSTDVSTWSYTGRDWTPGSASNTGVAALLDVCQLIGFDGMQTAYRAIYPLHPPYGAVMSQNVIDTFVAAVPVSQQTAVRAKLNRVGY